MPVLEVCEFRGLAVLFHDGLTQRPLLVEAFLMDLIQSLLNSLPLTYHPLLTILPKR